MTKLEVKLEFMRMALESAKRAKETGNNFEEGIEQGQRIAFETAAKFLDLITE